MIWFTLRQFRAQTWVTVTGLVVVGIALTITGLQIARLYTTSGLGGCATACDAAAQNFLNKAGPLADLAGTVLYVVPALVGMFWGAPLVARELETGTHRLVWNQSITRNRWLATKLGTIGLVTVATVGLLTASVSIWAHRIDEVAMSRITPQYFGTRGVVPMAYAAFALALGVTAGLLIRRTVPAMAVTLAVYVGAVVSMSTWVRAHLLPVDRIARPLDTSALSGVMITEGERMELVGDTGFGGGWVVSSQTVTPTGDLFTGPAHAEHCDSTAPFQECMDWVDSLGLRQDISYHPADHFWPLQWIESGIFFAAALVLAGVCFWWVRRIT
jgi:hypothetical protein